MNDLKRLLSHVRPHWVTFSLAAVAMVFVAVFETATGALLIPIFNQFAQIPGPPSWTLYNLHRLIPQDDWYRAWLSIAGMLMVFTVLKGIAEYFSSYLMARIGQTVVLDLRKQLYDHILNQPAAFFERHRTNFLVSRLVVSCSAIEHAVSGNLRDVLRESLLFVFLLGSAFYLNWRLMIAAVIIAPIIGVLTTRFSKALRRLAEESFEGNKLLTDVAQETLANQAIVKAYSGQDRERARFARVASIIARANLRSGKIAATSPPVIEIIGMSSILILLYFGLRAINANEMDAAQFFGFLYFLFRSYDPLRRISRQHNEISKAFAAAKDVWNILDETERLPEKENAVELGPLRDKIELRQVTFNYANDPGKKILDEVTFEIRKGTMVALVGESGGGKSSLIKLIQRLYDPSDGNILWDGIDLRDAKVSSLKRHIALVTQETVLFNESVRYNISYGDPMADDDDIAQAARIAFADEFINELPEGYDTIVGERGILLSGGQRQRLAIARAVLLDAPVLILDEATSALDAESERLVQKALANLMQDRTSIVIAHRLSTIRRADVIIVMERGRVIQVGTHDELLEDGGKYKRLYELQFAEEELAEPTFIGRGLS